MTQSTLPRILVLLTTHNGAAFLEEQLDSVLSQRGVDVDVLVSDDASTDGTGKILARYAAAAGGRVRVLEPGVFGSATANFFRIMRDADVAGYDAVGFCDQDDVWVPGKLERHFNVLALPNGLDGRGAYWAVSSNVTAFTAAGERQLVVKNQLQRSADYMFESAGPGSTFLLRPEAFALVQRRLLAPDSVADATAAHDWLAYALVRASGGRWFIDGESSVEYRQHGKNALGANEGLSQYVRRFRSIANGQFRRNALGIVEACLEVASPAERGRLEWMRVRLERLNYLDRLRLARRVSEFRRRRRDQLALAGTLVLGLF
ncbi:glycosyltransferase [Gulosibacter sediminis]|uniref:glycosyltransferase n=1 Tax=Gulosibacter sediminis TaxID=1729695 RepID=UPI0024AC8A82|nr:glycosyltransferase [Gulosibacter sediminis]